MHAAALNKKPLDSCHRYVNYAAAYRSPSITFGSSPVNKKIALRKSQILNPWKCSLLFETMHSIPIFPVILSLCYRKYYMHGYHSEFKFLFRLKFSEYSKSILCISQPETSQSVFWGVGGRGNPSSDNAIMSQVKIFVSFHPKGKTNLRK